MRRLSAGVCLVLVLAAAPVLAQEPMPAQPLTAISHFKVAPGQGEAWADWMVATYGDTLADLQAAGTVLTWGIGSPLFHADMNTTQSAYFSVPSYAALEDAFEALEAVDAAMDEEQMKDMQEMWAGVDLDTHHDELVRHVRFVPADDPGTGRYIALSTHSARPGGGDVLALYDRLVEPIYAALKEQGHILAYGVYVPELHMGGTTTHTAWAVLDDLAGMDAMSAAFAEAEASWTEDDYKQLAAAFDRSAHRDVILRLHETDADAGSGGD